MILKCIKVGIFNIFILSKKKRCLLKMLNFADTNIRYGVVMTGKEGIDQVRYYFSTTELLGL